MLLAGEERVVVPRAVAGADLRLSRGTFSVLVFIVIPDARSRSERIFFEEAMLLGMGDVMISDAAFVDDVISRRVLSVVMGQQTVRRRLSFPFALALALALVVAVSTSAHAQLGPGRDVDLVVEMGFVSYPQTHALWAQYPLGIHQDVSIGDCGCLLATLSSMAEFHYGGSSLPAAPWVELYTGETTLSFSPRYLDLYLMYGDPASATPPASGWGYKALRPGTCGTAPKRWALESSARPTVITNPDTGQVLVLTPTGLRWDAFEQAGPAAFDTIDTNLIEGRPTIVVIERENDSGGTSLHAQMVVGWDNSLFRYKIMDPAWPSFLNALVPGGDDEDSYSAWLTSVVKVFDVHAVTEPLSGIVLYDDPGPLELMVIGPDGRRTGFDPALGRNLRELETAEAYALGSWTDPTGVLAETEPARFVEVSEPADGTWRFLVTGTGDGDAPLTLSTIRDGVETVLLEGVTPLTLGAAIKYEMRYTRSGVSTAAQVTNFTPEARLHGPSRARADEPVSLDGGASFDADGTVTSYLWDFADGTTASGATASHAWSAPGVYPVRLTVTDDGAATGTTLKQVIVSGSSTATGGRITERVSAGELGEEVFGLSQEPSITPDHRFVAFTSGASSLVPDDVNGVPDVFVKDIQTGAIERVSVSSTGEEAAPDSFLIGSSFPSVSADGRFVAFTSRAANLVAGNTNGQGDVFVHDRQTGTTEMISVSSTGEAGNGSSTRPAISADGRFVAFLSGAANLVPGSGSLRQVYLRDRIAGTTELISASAAGIAGAGNSGRPVISADGRFVVFESEARNLVAPDIGFFSQVFVRDRQAGTIEVASLTDSDTIPAHHSFAPAMSGDGRFVAFFSDYVGMVAGDTNGLPDVFVRDRQAGTTTRVSVSTFGAEGDTSSFAPAISPDGRWVAFYSTSTNLVVDDTNRTGPLPSGLDVFLHDRDTGVTERVSVATDGSEALPDVGLSGGSVQSQVLSVGLGGAVAFTSIATNLVADDFNGDWDIFVRYRPVARPIADASGPYLGWASGVVPAHVTLDARRSFDPGGAPLTARWDFGDGTPVASADAATPVQHAYAAAGEFTVTLVVGNGAIDSEPTTTAVSIRAAPTAATAHTVAIPACGAPGANVRLHARGAPLAPTLGGFDFGAGLPPPALAAQPDATLPVSFTGAAGTRELVGTVDAVEIEGGVEQTTRVVVALPADLAAGDYDVAVDGATPVAFAVPCPPETELRPQAIAGGPYKGVAGVAVSLDGTASSAPGGGALDYTWDLGDGQTASGATPQHIYAEPGTYLVTLVVNDGVRSSIPVVRGGSFAQVVISPADPSPADPSPADPGVAVQPPGGNPPGGCNCGQGGDSTLAVILAGLVRWGVRRRARSTTVHRACPVIG